MLTALAILTFAQLSPGPLDAFRANYASIKVDLEYVYRKGGVDAATVADGRLWRERPLNFVGDPRLAVVGRWSCDGEVEWYYFSSPEEVLEAGRKQPKVLGAMVPYVPEHEGIYDGVTLAGHLLHDDVTMDRGQVIQVWNNRSPGFLSMGKGPFFWWISYPFPQILEVHFPGATPTRRKAERDGHPTEVEIYHRTIKGGWHQIEVSYDPAIGYLPRYARMVVFSGDKTGLVKTAYEGLVKETYLVEARPCAAGGVVPTEWYDTSYEIDGFQRRYPGYNDDTLLAPSGGAALGHFKVTSFRDRAAPVTLTHLEEIRWIASAGGRVPLPPGTSALTLPDVKKALGTRLTNPKPAALPKLNVDEAEMRQYSRPPARRWSPYLYGALGGVILLVSLFVWRRRRSLSALLGLLGMAGCGMGEQPAAKLTAAFTQPRLLYNLNDPAIPLTLVVKNEGNQALRIFKAEGGCACRQVDQSRFPTLLKPSGELPLTVSISPGRASLPQSFNFAFETNWGSLVVPVYLHALPRHQLSPETPSCNALNEGDEWTFEIVHRSIREASEPQIATELRALEPRFAIEKTGVHSGQVGMAPEFVYEDTTYRITLVDHNLGLHKSELVLQDLAENQPLLVAPTVWQRVAYLSSVPDRVPLGAHPVRVFLRCPDESVELTRVLSAPEGVKAVVSSPREVTVRLDENAPGIIDSLVEVGTTAEGWPPLRIPVVRYAPPSG